MLRIGQKNVLRIVKRLPQGIYLDGGKEGEILMPKRYVTDEHKVDDVIEVFIYLDSEDRLVATTETPLAMVDEVAYLKVISVNKVGAFMDWGLQKDLLVPHNEQKYPFRIGESYVVYLFLDDRSNRIAATEYLDEYLSESSFYYKENQAVDLLICSKTELAYKAVINQSHLGLIYSNEVFQPLEVGQKIKGYIKKIRADKKIDLCLQPLKADKKDEALENVKKSIIAYLIAHDGSSTLSDKSNPDDIYATFKVSKKVYKRALSSLYKERKILINGGKISITFPT
ncbi:MAG: GntR family transcriptional regulator [Aquificaceae bacterium]|nr:MAG: GntR family transcriptional regulator [Aquificaceae bacterium]